MIKTLTFGTTNEGKLAEAREILGVEVEGVGIDVNEIQSLDPEAVAIDKAQRYFEKHANPLFIEDVSLTFHGLGQLPGTFIDYFSKSLGNEGLTNLLTNIEDKSATAQTTIVYIENIDNYHVFKGSIKGRIADSPRGDQGFGWDPIFIPESESKTFAEIESSEKNKYSMRKLALEEFKKWLIENK